MLNNISLLISLEKHEFLATSDATAPKQEAPSTELTVFRHMPDGILIYIVIVINCIIKIITMILLRLY